MNLIFGRAFLILFITGSVVSMATAQTPVITRVSKISTLQYQTIVIAGSGFGTQAPYTGDSPFISLLDQSTTPPWQAGYSPFNDTVTLIVEKWIDSEIVLGGFSGAWGELNYKLTVGDSEQIEIWNAQSGAGPAQFTTTIVEEATRTTLTSSPNPSVFGEAVTFIADVDSTAGAPPDGEPVLFVEGETIIGKRLLKGGSAVFSISSLKVGTNSVIAVYRGDSQFSGSKSAPVKQVVQ